MENANGKIYANGIGMEYANCNSHATHPGTLIASSKTHAVRRWHRTC